MAAPRRPIDITVLKFYGAMIGLTVAVFAPVTLWIWATRADNGQEAPWLNAAFTWSWLLTILMMVPILEYARRRPDDGKVTWGEAMLGATYVFFLLFWIYGVVPHQWLVYADNELGWRADKLVVGPTGLGFTNGEGLVAWALPMDITYLVIRDIIAVTIYGLFLAGNIAAWSLWQGRGKVAPTEVEQTRYGRPLVREGVS